MSVSPPLFTVRPAEAEPVPVVVSIPHAGTFVPDEIARSYASDAMRALPMTDWHLQHLYDFLPSLGITTIHANFSRFVVDLNRAPDERELYPGRFETGLVPMKTFHGEAIFRESPSRQEIEARRERYHAPYHKELDALITRHLDRSGRAVLIDAHSIASAPTLMHQALTEDIYLGDRDGQSCGTWLMDSIAGAFGHAGLTVARNAPYKGGYITDHYGRRDGVDALQIEMCQRLYMNEADPAVAIGLPRFKRMQSILREVFSALVSVRFDDVTAR